MGPTTSFLKCGICGAWYGPKPEHSKHAVVLHPGYAITLNSATEKNNHTYSIPGGNLIVTANPAPANKVFDKWVSDDITISDTDAKNSMLTFEMPTKPVIITATYKDDPSIGGTNHNHSWQWVSDGNNHYQKCTVAGCNETQNNGVHTGGTATCRTQAVCSTCNLSYGSLASHDFSGNYEKDATGHYHLCKFGCGQKDTVATHVYDNEDTDTDCNVCGWTRTISPVGTTHVHVWDTTLANNENVMDLAVWQQELKRMMQKSFAFVVECL